jgi:Mg-chelatase subunit ChlD
MINVMFVLDETGSMELIKDETVKSFNNYIKELKKSKNSKKIKFSLLRFDSTKVDLYYDNVKLKEVKKLTDYKPGCMTPLYDALGKAINSIDNDICIVVVLTDGEENSSKEFNYQQIQKLIEEKQSKGWEFIYLATGLNNQQRMNTYYIGVNLNMKTSESPVVSGLYQEALYETHCYVDNNT